MKPTVRDVHIDRPLTNVSIAYRNAGYIASDIFPVVPVMHQSDKFYVFDKPYWFSNEAGLRAPGTRGPEVEYSLSSSTYACQPISATKVVADEMVDNADDPLQPQRDATEFATDKVLLYMEYDVASSVFASSVWSGSATPTTTWDDDASDPLQDIENARESIVSEIGREPNIMVIGREVWTDLKHHPDLIDRIKYTSNGGIMTLELAARLFEVDRLLVGNAIYTTTGEGARYPSSGTETDVTVTYSYIWGKNAWLGWVPPNASLMQPAAGYILAWKNRTAEVFRREEEKADAIRVEMHYDVKVTSPDAGYYLPSCVA